MKNSPYKLLVVDIDGTLTDKDGAISSGDKDALAGVRAAGVPVSLSTGRAAQASLKIINQLSLDGYHMFFDGALVSSPEKGGEVYARPISKELVGQIVEYAHRNNINLDLYSATDFFAEHESWSTEIRRQFFDLHPVILPFDGLWQRERIIKATVVVRSPEEKARAHSLYLDFKASLNFSLTKTPAYPDVDFINVLAPDVSKGKALEAMVAYLGIDLSQVMAIGDGTNDVSLLSNVGLAVAMGNAPEELKALADYVTLDVDHGGVAIAVRKFLLEKTEKPPGQA